MKNVIPSYNVLFNLGAENAASSQPAGIVMFNQAQGMRFGSFGKSNKPANPKVMLSWPGSKSFGWSKA